MILSLFLKKPSTVIIIFSLQMKSLSFREDKECFQGHTASKQVKSQGSTLGTEFFIAMQLCLSVLKRKEKKLHFLSQYYVWG